MSSRNVNKFKLAGLTVVPGRRVKAPIIKETSVVLECRVVDMVKAGDHVIVIGRVMESYVNAEKDAIAWYRGTP